MVSTPYAPDGLFDSIEKEPEGSCIYKRILLDYTYGLDKIYTKEEIDKARYSKFNTKLIQDDMFYWFSMSIHEHGNLNLLQGVKRSY